MGTALRSGFDANGHFVAWPNRDETISATVRTYETDGDPANETSTDTTIGGRVDLFDTNEHIAAVTLHPNDDGTPGYMLTVYRDIDVPISIRTVDYFLDEPQNEFTATMLRGTNSNRYNNR